MSHPPGPIFSFREEGGHIRLTLSPDCRVYVQGEWYWAWSESDPRMRATGGLVGTLDTGMHHIADLLRDQLSPDDPRWAEAPPQPFFRDVGDQR